MQNEDLELARRVAEALKNLEVEATGTDATYRSALRKVLAATNALASEVLEPDRPNKAALFTQLLYSAYKFICCFHGILPAKVSSFFAHVSAREFWDEYMENVSHASLDELKKALGAKLPKELGSAWLSKLSFEGHGVGEKEFGALTDAFGVVGGVAKAANRVPYVLPAQGGATLQIASVWEDDLKLGKPVRQALEALGTINRFLESDQVGTMLVEMCEEEAVTMCLKKQQKGLQGHPVSRASETIEAAYARSVAKEEVSKSVIGVMLKESSEQAEALVGSQAKARELLTQASDSAWKERLHILLDILRKLISFQAARVNALRVLKEQLKEESGGSGSALAKGSIQKLLQPIRRAASRSSLASLTERRRSSGGSAISLAGVATIAEEGAQQQQPAPPPILSPTSSSSSGPEETPRRRSATAGPGSLIPPSSASIAIAKEDASEEGSSEGGIKASTPETSTEKKSVSRVKKVRKKKTVKDSSLTGSTGGGADDGSDESTPAPAASIEELFGRLYDQLRVSQAALQAKEEKLKLREGRLRAKKRSLEKRVAAANATIEAARAELDKRERLLDSRERVYENRMRRLTRLQKEEHMKELMASFSKNPEQVVPLQRALRKWLCKAALKRCCKIVSTHEAFKENRRRNAALFEIHSSELEHVTRMEQIILYKKMWSEQLPATGRHGVPPTAISRIFLGLEDAVDAGKNLLRELSLRKSAWPSNTRVGDIFIKWCQDGQMMRYKTFVNNYDSANVMLQECRQKKAFVEFEQEMIQRGLPSLDSLLICPIQRLPRYRLLLESLVSLTQDDHCDKPALGKALEAIRADVDSVNQGKAVAEQMQVLLQLDEQVFGQDPAAPIVVPGRTIVHKGFLGDILDPRAPPKMYYLFNDALFEFAPRKRSSLGVLTARRAVEEFDFIRAFPLSPAQLELHEIPPSVAQNGFSLINSSSDGSWKEISFFAISPQDLRGWVVAIKGMRKQPKQKVLCQNCGATVFPGAERCHVCSCLVLELPPPPSNLSVSSGGNSSGSLPPPPSADSLPPPAQLAK